MIVNPAVHGFGGQAFGHGQVRQDLLGFHVASAVGQPLGADVENHAQAVSDGVAQGRPAILDAGEPVAGDIQLGGEGGLGPVNVFARLLHAAADLDFSLIH